MSKKQLKDTGERVIPNKMHIMNSLLIEHVARYQFACHFVTGRVLDIASGSGYGSHIIAKTCKGQVENVVGVDNDPAVVQYAKGTYYHPLSTFKVGDVTSENLTSDMGQFDSIVSFETIEHLEDEQLLLKNLSDLLRPGGTLILSTPFGEGRGIPSGVDFHTQQFTLDEFQAMFSEYQNVQYFFQKGPLIMPEGHSKNQCFPLGIVVCQK